MKLIKKIKCNFSLKQNKCIPSTQVTKRNKSLFVDYKPFHKKGTNFSKNKMHYTIYNQIFKCFKGWDLVLSQSQLSVPGFQGLFQGDKRKSREFHRFQEI